MNPCLEIHNPHPQVYRTNVDVLSQIHVAAQATIKKSSKTVFNINNNKKMFLKQQISILEWFLKDHVTLKTGVMMLKIQLYNQRNKLHFKIYLNRKQLF